MDIAYKEFIENKRLKSVNCGFDVNIDDINPMLFDFQKTLVKWALHKGRCAIFADCGLGKTPMQLEWSKHIYNQTSGDILILAPLAVSMQTQREGQKFGIDVNICRSDDDVNPGINITNYEMLHNFDVSRFMGVVLDESSILKNYTGKIRTQIIDTFLNTPYKLCATATPSPNDYTELGNTSEFLGVMTRSEMLSMFFINDTSDVGTWRLKGHVEDNKFWEWMSSWAVMLQKPSDLGFDDGKFILPELHIEQITIPYEGEKDTLFAYEAKTLTDRRDARRESLNDRVKQAANLVNNDDDLWLIWCDLNSESELLKNSINNSVEVKGSDKNDHKEKSLLGFADGNIKCLVTKPSIAGHGMNLQKCHNVIFVGLSDSYEQYYQAVRRCWRFGQNHPVNVYVITGEREGAVVDNIKRKEADMQKMYAGMVDHIKNSIDLNDENKPIGPGLSESKSGKSWTMYNGDSVEVIKNIPSNSIHYSIFSPPFASLFTYSDSERDMGNCKSDKEFFDHFMFLAPEIYRVIMPGRLMSFHCMNLPATITHDGFMGIKDFRGDLIRIFQKSGFIFHSEVVIWKDPLVQATRTKVLSLAHKQISKDSTRCGQGLPDYIITMRKPGDNLEPVSHGRGFERYIGEMGEPMEKKTDNARTNKYSHKVWQRYASPVWWDIKQTNTLNIQQARDEKDEKHVCPLQLDVIARCLELWSNEGDTVLSPFAGIGSEGWGCLKNGRKFIGIELKRSYFETACRYLDQAENVNQLNMFK